MAAANTDKLKKVAPNTGWQLGGGGVADAVTTTIPLVSATGLPTDTAVLVTIDRVDSGGNKTPSKMERVVGVVSGNNIISCIRGVEGTAQSHSGGAVVEIVIAPKYWNDIIDWALVEHNQDGTHKLAAIASAMQTWDGWVAALNTWSAVDANTISVNADITTLIQKGDKLKLTNNSAVKYFYVTTTPVFATGATTFDVTGEVDLVAGAITLPHYSKIENPQGFKRGESWYKAKGHVSYNPGLPHNTYTTCVVNVKDFDPNNNYDTGNFRYVVPITGYYRVIGTVCVNNAGGNLIEGDSAILKNGVKQPGYGAVVLNGKAWTMTIPISMEMYLTKGDYISLQTYAYTFEGSSSTYTGSDSTLSVQFVSI